MLRSQASQSTARNLRGQRGTGRKTGFPVMWPEPVRRVQLRLWFLTGVHLEMSGNSFDCYSGLEELLASRGWSPGMLLNTLPCPTVPAAKDYPAPNVTSVKGEKTTTVSWLDNCSRVLTGPLDSAVTPYSPFSLQQPESSVKT